MRVKLLQKCKLVLRLIIVEIMDVCSVQKYSYKQLVTTWQNGDPQMAVQNNLSYPFQTFSGTQSDFWL